MSSRILPGRGHTVSVTDMADHIASLCSQLGIAVDSHSRGGRAWRKSRRISIRPIRSAVTYAVALHEIGHVVGPMQSQPRLFAETGAWIWAKENALIWTPAMTKKMRSCLASYERMARRRAGFVKLPEHGHPFWMLLGQQGVAENPRQLAEMKAI